MRIYSPTALVSLVAALAATCGYAQAVFPAEALDAVTTPPEDERVIPAPKLPAPEGAKPMPEPDEVWVDAKNKQVLVDGYVSLREGYLEMFACIVGTKEHESIVAVKTKAQTVHAALLAIGAKSGTPVQWQPKYKPPTGTEIDVEVRWLGENGKWKSAKAQEWIRDAKTEKPMEHPFVFAGSGFWKEPETGKEYYMAESGDFICVSNFTTAMLDVPIESSQSNEALTFEANTERIPTLGTPVRLVLTPKLKDAKKQAEAKQEPATP
ncbi:MAG TPA: YdjY domain-containing protein [Lacipirellula sp.]